MYKISITIAKALKFLINAFNLGAGSTWTGHIVLKLYPAVLNETALLPKKGLILISGTNGKTTTTKMFTHVLKKRGFSVTTNSSGANLVNGIVASLVLDTDLFGGAKSDYGVFEVDEFALPNILKKLTPDYLVLLNLSRDQLDRYGETDIIFERWAASLSTLSEKTSLVINEDQPEFIQLSRFANGRVFLSGPSSLSITTALAARFNISPKVVNSDLEDFQPAWGRGELIKHGAFKWEVCLAKNPASFNNNLNTFSSNTYLIIFNDNIPDGRDVSWIYDISTEKLYEVFSNKNIYVSGKRAFDMAVRLQYAGISIDTSKVIPNIQEAVMFVENGSGSKEAVAFPNYSAMLELRKILLGRSIL